MKPHRLGTFACPSGNHVHVDLAPEGDDPDVRKLLPSWDADPTPADMLTFYLFIVPRAVDLMKEYLERPGTVAVVIPL